MKWKSRILGLLCLGILCFSCGDDDSLNLGELEENHLVFGQFFGFCVGEMCIENYALTSTKLYEDTVDAYQETNFEFVELNEELFEEVKDLADAFPEKLLQEEEGIIGCPDCGDWGGYLISYVRDGQARTWFVDTQEDSVPEYLNIFTRQIKEKIDLINEQ